MRTLTSSLIAANMLICTIAVMAEVNKTTVFADKFNRDSVSPGGTPEMIYSVSSENIIIENSTLKLACPKDGTNSQNIVIGSLSNFSAPYKAKLSEIADDSIMWSFNVRQNYGTTNAPALSGFNSGKRGIAAIITADGNDWTNANGYAIINGGNSTVNFRLVKFTNGLYNQENFTDIIAGKVLSSGKLYMSFHIIYIPATNTWRFYQKEEAAFVDPFETSDYVCNGTSIDNTYTNTEMTSFGFYQNYTGTQAFNFWIDNYTVNTYKTSSPTTDIKAANSTFKVCNTTAGVDIVTEKEVNIAIYNTVGLLLAQKNITGSFRFTPDQKGVYFIRMKTAEGIITHKFTVK